ncbi:MAG: oligopeptidase B, partial [Longimicrobiales bacterium]
MTNPKNLPAPPDCPQRPHTLEAHGHVRVDPYYWIRDPEDPEVLEYLEAENEYLESATKTWPHSPDDIFAEMRGRIKEQDQSVPYRVKDYWYRTKFEEGAEYPLFVRRGLKDEDEEKVILDVNELAEGLAYCEVVQIKVSEDQNLLAYGIDTTGRRLFDVRVRDLTSGVDLPDRIPNTSADIAWAADDDFLFYVKQDLATLRPNQLFRHRLGTDPADDVLVFEETDETFHLSVYKTKSRDYIMSASFQTISAEFRALKASAPTGEFRTILPRERGHEYT